MFRSSLPLLLASALLGCSADLGDAPIQHPTAAPVIVRLQLRNGELELTSTGGNGVRYSFQGEASNSFAYLTLEELDRRAPELSEVARSASASASAGRARSFIDASFILPPKR